MSKRSKKKQPKKLNDWPNPLPAYFSSHPKDIHAAFATRAGVSIDTLRAWIQWKRRPELEGRRACERASFGAIPVAAWLRPGERDEDGNVGAGSPSAASNAAA